MDTSIAAVGLTLLSQPEDAVLRVVFVHGLQGHPHTTWTFEPKSAQKNSGKAKSAQKNSGQALAPSQDAEAKNVFWPRDLLKEDFPMARIMTFGYNSNITEGYSAANQGIIFSYAKNLLQDLTAKRKQTPNRHLVFIAHSLGGILVKEVLRRSEVDPDQKVTKIFSSTTGVFFFGTPHRGSTGWASFGEGLAAVAGRIMGVDVNTKVIRALLPSGIELQLCRESFTAHG